MGNLLFDEQPFIISRELAKIIGLNEAIVLQQIHYWLEINRKANINFKDNKYWTYNSIKNWKLNNFDFWSIDTVKRTFSNLEKRKLLISGNYNQKKYDQTKWYTIDYKSLETLKTHISAKCTNGLEQNAPMDECKMHQPIPEITKEITKEISKSKSDMTLTIDDDNKQIKLDIEKKSFSNPTYQSKSLKNSITNNDYSTYKKIIQDNIDYTYFSRTQSTEIDLVNELVNCMLDVICTKGDTVKINGENKNREMIKSIYLKVKSTDIEHIIDRYKTINHKITHLNSYLKTMLYTCKQENGHYYTNAVQADGVV